MNLSRDWWLAIGFVIGIGWGAFANLADTISTIHFMTSMLAK